MNDRIKKMYNEIMDMYPQLMIPVKEGISQTEEYKAVVLKDDRSAVDIMWNKYGSIIAELEEAALYYGFVGDENDRLDVVNTPVGEIKVITFGKREDFERAIRCIVKKCEPVKIPASMGAIFLNGVNNHVKFRRNEEFKDTLIILSSGAYSNVWSENAVTIRKFHELTHFIMRKSFPDDVNALRDEVLADAMGLIAAYNKFDAEPVKLFLGTKGDKYKEGGRLENYTDDPATIMINVNRYADALEEFLDRTGYLKKYKRNVVDSESNDSDSVDCDSAECEEYDCDLITRYILDTIELILSDDNLIELAQRL